LMMEHHGRKGGCDGDSALGPYLLGNFSPSIVDICLIPQLYNARKYGVDVDKDFPQFAAIEQRCASHPWFIPAHPRAQVDAPSSE
jgi:glutathione S-transferase